MLIYPPFEGLIPIYLQFIFVRYETVYSFNHFSPYFHYHDEGVWV
jgi:hypothetical protein